MSQKSINNQDLDNVVSQDKMEESLTMDTLANKLYIPLGNPKPVNDSPIALAFTVSDDIPPVAISGVTLAWNKQAIAVLANIQKSTRSDRQAQIKNLPYASLRGLFEVRLDKAARIESGIGLQRVLLYPQDSDNPPPFAYLNATEEPAIRQLLRSVLDNWIVHYLKPFAKKEQVPIERLEALEELWEHDQLISITPFTSQVLPWTWHSQTGTTQVKDNHAFLALVDYAARLIAGQEIFKGLGSMRRVLSSGSFTSGSAELISNPISITDKGKFSLVVTLEVITFPSLHQPLLKIDVSKRRWLEKLGSPGFDRNNIRAFAFSDQYDDRAFSFKVSCRRDQENNQQWQTDSDFVAIQNQLQLPMRTYRPQEIASGQSDTDSCQFLLTYRDGLNAVAGRYSIKAGVPEIDKLEAFEAIAKILNPPGLQPFNSYKPVSYKKTQNDSASRTINLPTLIGAMLESQKVDRPAFTPKFIASLEDDQLDLLLNQHFNLLLEQIYPGRKSLQFNTTTKSQTEELTTLIKANQSALRRLYPDDKILLVIFYESDLQADVKLLKSLIQLLCGDAIEILINRLPAHTHGSKAQLPGNHLNAKERSKLRREAWETITQQLENRKQRIFCLVMAKEYYSDSQQHDRFKHDDSVNKPSTRQALAALAGSCVQFILPMDRSRSTNQLNLEKFFHRAQSALKDLLFAHSGRIDDVQAKVERCLKDLPADNRPKEIIGITIVRKQKGRKRVQIENTFLPIAIRLNVETGRCDMCCAYERANALMISPWTIFPDAIGFIANISPVKLADKRAVQKTRFMEFVRTVISSSVEAEAQPVVLVDSSNCVQLWDWLADVRIDAQNINLGQQYQWMQQEWQGARIVRVRQGLAPGIIDKTQRQLVETSLEDERSKDDLKLLEPDHVIPCASSSSKLFRLTVANETKCITYLSPGGKRLHDNKRGLSCYHSTEINTAVKDPNSKKNLLNASNLPVHHLHEFAPHLDQWPTPNPLEIVVTLRQPNDNPDQLAALVESLRYSFGHYGDWATLPAPLFFERVVRDYISEFAIQNLDEIDENEPE